MAVCHSVVVDWDPKTNQLIYQASSPDELALVNASKEVNIELISRTKQEIEVKIGDWKDVYWISKEFPFNSDRKWMSVMI